MKLNLPERLYRGDTDSKNQRNLRHAVDHGFIMSNLASGGIGRDIFEKPLLHLIDKHVAYEWNQTHFLSFSEDKNIAISYGNKDGKLVEEDWSSTKDWDFILITLKLNEIEDIQQVGDCVYKCNYTPTTFEFARLSDKYSLILINVVQTLSISSERELYEDSILKSKESREWLLLPATEVPLNFNTIEFSSKIDTGNVFTFQKFKFIR